MPLAWTGSSEAPNLDLRHPLIEWLDHCPMFSVRMNDAQEVPESTEAKLVSAARGGDENAFRQIVEGYQATLAAQMRRFSRDQGVVEDLVHDVFVEAFISLGSFREKSPLEHWLRKIAVRIGYRYWKLEARDKSRSEKLREDAAAVKTTMESPDDATDAREQLHVMLMQLAPRDRLVLTLLYWDGHSVAEAAKLAGWTQSMVKVQAHRARKRLKKLLEETE